MTAPTRSIPTDLTLLDDLFDSWRRNNLILLNLLRALPEGTMELRAAEGSPTVRELFLHMHYCRLVFVQATAPEVPAAMPAGDWRSERSRGRIGEWLQQSAAAMVEAVRGRLLAGRATEEHYDHPILMLQHFVWHEGYHHGQIKIALKLAGRPFDDEEIGSVTWDVWMKKDTWR